MNEYIIIGKIVATFGLKGEMILKHELGEKNNMDKIKAVFIEEFRGSYLPYFIQCCKEKTKDEILLELDEITTKETAQKLLKKNVWLTQKDFKIAVAASSPMKIIGYKLYDDESFIGNVEDVIEQPHQILIKLFINKKEMLIPLHNETLKKIDRRKKEVHVHLPDGLLEVYQ